MLNLDAVVFALVLTSVPYLIGFCHAWYLAMKRAGRRRKPPVQHR
jgi:ABC-type spermidine/putrescine transport system permease subunit I